MKKESIFPTVVIVGEGEYSRKAVSARVRAEPLINPVVDLSFAFSQHFQAVHERSRPIMRTTAEQLSLPSPR